MCIDAGTVPVVPRRCGLGSETRGAVAVVVIVTRVGRFLILIMLKLQ